MIDIKKTIEGRFDLKMHRLKQINSKKIYDKRSDLSLNLNTLKIVCGINEKNIYPQVFLISNKYFSEKTLR